MTYFKVRRRFVAVTGNAGASVLKATKETGRFPSFVADVIIGAYRISALEENSLFHRCRQRATSSRVDERQLPALQLDFLFQQEATNKFIYPGRLVLAATNLVLAF